MVCLHPFWLYLIPHWLYKSCCLPFSIFRIVYLNSLCHFSRSTVNWSGLFVTQCCQISLSFMDKKLILLPASPFIRGRHSESISQHRFGTCFTPGALPDATLTIYPGIYGLKTNVVKKKLLLQIHFLHFQPSLTWKCAIGTFVSVSKT